MTPPSKYGVQSQPPAPWLRALRELDRTVHRAAASLRAVHEGLYCAWVPPSRRAALTAWVYDQRASYTQGGGVFAQGLWPWERALLGHPALATARTFLLGGAGGGREALALLERGHRVVAFEPSPLLCAASRRALAGRDAVVLEGSYEGLLGSERGRATLRAQGPFDAVLLGWGSLSHVTEAAQREALFASLAELAPGAPVAFSFLGLAGLAGGREARLREAVVRVSTLLGAPGRPEPGLRFLPEGGFVLPLEAPELERLAHVARASVALCERHPYPHALLVPRGASP